MMLTLQGLTWDHPRGFAPLVACSREFAAAHGVNIMWTTQSLLDFALTPVEQLTEHYDLLILDHPHIGQAARANCLLPLDEHLEPGVLDGLSAGSVGPSHDSYRYDGHQWALAVDAASHSSAARPDLVESPLPHTWQAVLALGQSLNTREQFLGMTLVPVSAMCSFLTLCAAHGGPPGHTGELVTADIGQLALDLLWQMAALAHPRSFELNTVQLLDHMSTVDDTPYCPLVFCYSNYSRTGFRPNRLRFSAIPGISGALLGGAGIAIARHSTNIRAALAFSIWLCSADIQRTTYAAAGGQPAHRAAWIDPALNDQTHGFFRDMLSAMKQAYLRPRHPGFAGFLRRGGETVVQFLQGEISPSMCLATLETLYQQSF